MWDRLFEEHREIQVDSKRIRLSEDERKRIQEFARYPVAKLHPYLFDLSKDIVMAVHAIELQVRSALSSYFAQISPIEREVCTILALYKLQSQLYHPNTSVKEQWMIEVIGTMLQHRLTRFFLDLDPRDGMEIFALGHGNATSVRLWKKSVTDASSRARTIVNFLSATNCYVFLPSVEENMNWNMDLIVITETGYNLCVTVNPGKQNGAFYIEQVHKCPRSNDPSLGTISRRAIYGGTQQFNTAFKEEFVPCRAIVGQTNGEAIDFSFYPQDLRIIKDFLTRGEAALQPKKDAAA